MKTFRTVLFWMHLVSGVIAAIVVFIMSVTGVALMYEKQMIAWADTRAYQAGPPSPGAARLPVETLIARVREARPDVAPATVTLKAAPDAPAAFALGPQGNLYVHAYSGAILGTGAPGTRQFFRSMTDWHRWLAMQGDQRPTGRAITGACNALFLFLVLSGAYLWIPKIRNWRQFRNVLWFRGGLPGKARDFNWHNVLGIWSFVPLVVIVFSGAVISYPFVGNQIYRMYGEQPPAPQRPPGGPGGAGAPGGGAAARAEGPRGEGRRAEGTPAESGRGARAEGAPGPSLEGLNAAWTRAEQQMPAWQTISLRLPSGAAPAVFTIDGGYAGQPQLRGTLTLDRRTGDVVRWETFGDLSPGRQMRSWLRFSHTGEYYGLPGQTIAGLVSAAAAVLVYTGLALAWRRFVAWRKRRAAAGTDADAVYTPRRESPAA